MAHCNTIFHQMIKLISRHHFAKLEAEHGTGRKARSFTRWSQLVHFLTMQLTARASLRDGIASPAHGQYNELKVINRFDGQSFFFTVSLGL
jgi:hypothetical protein